MNKISLFHSLGFPILIGTSRKKFINQISGNLDTKEELAEHYLQYYLHFLKEFKYLEFTMFKK